MIIGIAGGTSSGKTTLAKEISSHFNSNNVEIVAFDDYSRGLKNLDDNLTNFDQPGAFRYDDFIRDLGYLAKGENVLLNVLSADKNNPPEKTKILRAKPIIIVEGFLIFYRKISRSIFDERIFIDLPEKDIIERRIRRSRDKNPWNSTEYIKKTALTSHRKYVLPQIKYCNHVLDGRKDTSTLLQSAVNIITIYQKTHGQIHLKS